eukprot:18520-Prorocentrum_minimum.AAC.1
MLTPLLPGDGAVPGGRPHRPRGHGQDGDRKGHGPRHRALRLGLQLLRPVRLPRPRQDLQGAQPGGCLGVLRRVQPHRAGGEMLLCLARLALVPPPPRAIGSGASATSRNWLWCLLRLARLALAPPPPRAIGSGASSASRNWLWRLRCLA